VQPGNNGTRFKLSRKGRVSCTEESRFRKNFVDGYLARENYNAMFAIPASAGEQFDASIISGLAMVLPSIAKAAFRLTWEDAKQRTPRSVAPIRPRKHSLST
jgi:hypothetical protein